MDYKISKRYKASVQFESSVDCDDNNYLVIYGKHINGGWCCIPNWGIGCEMSDPDDTFYNYENLVRRGIEAPHAKAIANAIRGEAVRKEAVQ